ncbi:MAG: nickel-dependent lactate racemase [Promethearchaeota archaeon]
MKFDYGKEGIDVKLDPEWNVTILKPSLQKSFDNPIEKIKESIKNPIQYPPLKEILKNKEKVRSVCIVASDVTRPVPSNLILKALLDELDDYGINDDQIMILIATALHRPSREEELERFLGKDIISRIRVIDHIATDRDSLVNLGVTSDNIPILINKNYYNSDLKILTGYVEPHFFFGFSGGRKSIVPGIAGEETILANHSAKNIASPYARFGVYKENPLHKNAIEITKKVGVDFVVNVCINENHEIIKVAAGDLEKTHETLVLYQLKHIFNEINKPYDIVVCGNGGYPLDLNLYQAVKSMAIGEMGIKEGGTIIAVNECADGIGIGQDQFRELLFSGMSPKEIHKKILNKEIFVPDQWEIQILARILMKAEIFIISKLKKNEIGNIGLKYTESIEEAIKVSLKKHGSKAKILILPNGPQILPLLNRYNNKKG